MTARIVSFGGSRVRIDCVGPRAVEVVDFLYRHLPPSEGPPPHIAFQVRAEPDEGALTLLCGDAISYQGDSIADLAVALLEQTIYHLSDKSQGGLMLHAAAVNSRGGCILLPGQSGVGKTTLTAWLVKEGFGYLTDELVYVPFGSHDILPFVRPLKFKASAKGTLETEFPEMATRASDTLQSLEVTLVQPGALSRVPAEATTRLARIIFPRYQPGGPCTFEPIAKAQAGMRLMGCLINARNLPAHGFHEVTRLVRDVQAHALQYSDFAQIERLFLQFREDRG